VNGPLWLIAFSLFTIAICMVFLVLDKKFGPPKDEALAEVRSEARPLTSRPERPGIRAFDGPGRGDPFADLAPPPAKGDGTELPESLPDGQQGFLPTTMPTAGSYLPAVPRIVGQPNYQTAVRGRVILQGTPPPEQATPLPAEYPCALPEPPVLRTHYFSGTNGGLANTVVYIASGLTQAIQPPETASELVLTNCRIEPSFNVIVRGQGLRMRDAEGLQHVFDGLGFATNQPAPIEIAARGSATLRTLIYSTNPIPLTCKLHPWESSDIWFISSTFFGVTDKNGAYTITNIPPGNYVLEAAHWSGLAVQKVSKKITIRPDQTTSAFLVIQAPSPETAGRF